MPWHHHGIRVLPDPVAPAPELVIVENSAADNLLINDVYYSSFLSDDMSRTPASLLSSLDYFSLPVLTSKKNKVQQLTVPVADVLGLMHEWTGHANKRSLIE